MRVSDIFNINAALTVYNACATLYLAAGGPLPAAYGNISTPLMVGLGVVATGLSYLQWKRDINRTPGHPAPGQR